MQNQLTTNENQFLDEMFPDRRKKETLQPDEASVEAIRLAAVAFAKTLLEQCPSGPDRSAAMRLIRETQWTAEASLVTAKASRI